MSDFVLYCRVSTNRQELGLDAQREQATRYAESVGGKIIAEFSEHESGKNDKRTQLAAAIAAAKSLHATLLIAKLDRLSRRVAFLFNLKDELAKAGVDVVAADMPDVVKDTLTLGIFASLAQKEREMISSRTKAALQALKSKGKKLGNPLGTDTSKPTAASVASRIASANEWAMSNKPVIASLRNLGMTYAAVAGVLNQQGIKTRTGCLWTAAAVREVYIRTKNLQTETTN